MFTKHLIYLTITFNILNTIQKDRYLIFIDFTAYNSVFCRLYTQYGIIYVFFSIGVKLFTIRVISDIFYLSAYIFHQYKLQLKYFCLNCACFECVTK